MEDPYAAQALQTRWPCSSLLSWLGGLCGCYTQPHVQPHHVFFLSKHTCTLAHLAKPNSLTLCPIGSSCHLQSSIGKPEIRKPMHPTFSVVLNYTEVQGQFPTQPAWPLPCPSGFSLTQASCLSSGTVSYSIWGTIWGIGFEKKKGKKYLQMLLVEHDGNLV